MATALTMIAHLASAQTVIDALPYVISASGNYILDKSLTFLPGPGAQSAIAVNTSNVTIDLNGFYISKARNGDTSPTFGVFSNNRANITVKNGTIIGFQTGVAFDYLGGANINSNHLVDGVRFTNEQVTGIYLHHTTNCLIQNCSIAHTGYEANGNIVSVQGTGITVIDTNPGAGNALVNNRVTHSALTGISTGKFGGTYSDGNFVSKCLTGFQLAQDDKYRNNTTISCQSPFIANGATDLGGNN
jgi:hypothetical protein